MVLTRLLVMIMAASGKMDELIKEYLLYRGFTATAKALETESKHAKDKCFRVDKIMDQLHQYINSHELQKLLSYWSFLDSRLFCHLGALYTSVVRRLEIGLLKVYVVNASQANRSDKVNEFFEKKCNDIQVEPEWTDWFVLPFLKVPEENANFAMFFTKQWHDTYFLSLHNFIAVIISAMPVPTLLSYAEGHREIAALKEENASYRQQINALAESRQIAANERCHQEPLGGSTAPDAFPPVGSELMDDFCIISQETQTNQAEPKSQPKSQQIKTFIKNITLPSSPNLGRRPVAPPPAATGTTAAPAKKPPAAVASNDLQRSPKVRSGSGRWSHPPATGSSEQTLLPSGGQPRSRDGERSVTKAAKTAAAVAAVAAAAAAAAGVCQSSALDAPPPALTASPQRVGRGVTTSQAVASPDPVAGRQAVTSSEAVASRQAATSSEAVAIRRPSDCARRSSAVEETDGTMTGRGGSDTDIQSPFLLLSQDEYNEHHSCVTQCRFSGTNHTIATLDADGVVKVWAPEPSHLVTLVTTMTKTQLQAIDWVGVSDRWLLLGSRSASIRLFDVREKKMASEIATDAAFPRIVCLASSPGGRGFVCSASGQQRLDGRLTSWDVQTMTMKRHLPIGSPDVVINCVAYSPTGHLVATGGSDGRIQLYDQQSIDSVACWLAHKAAVYWLQISHDEKTCYSMASTGELRLWSLVQRGQQVGDLATYCSAAPLTSGGRLFSFDAGERHMLTCAQDGGDIYQLRHDGMDRVMRLGGHRSKVVCVDWASTADYNICLTADASGRVRVSALLTH